MKLCRVGNQTNSPDPVAVNSRVFVGNLNTFQCSKAELERMFQRYGRIAGISMHKGYAFVQFANAFDARSACLGEDKRMVLGQTLDVNLVSEPKAHQTGRKRQNVTKTGNDWDYYYDSYYATVGLPAGPPQRLAPPHKRARLMVPMVRPPGPPGPSPGLKHTPIAPPNGHLLNGQPALGVPHCPASPPLPAIGAGNTINVFSNPDILICGNCREMYTDLQELLSHKKSHCKLRFACKCHTLPEGRTNSEATLLCSSCRASFSSAWDLMVHVQAAHMLNIYQLGVPDGETAPSPPSGSGRQTPTSEQAVTKLQDPLQPAPHQQVSERLQASDTLSEPEGSEHDVAVASPAASPAASNASDQEVVLGATLQCNLTAEPLKDEDETLSPGEQLEQQPCDGHAWGAAPQQA